MFPSLRGLYIWDRILAAGRGRPSRVFARPILDRLEERLSPAANLFAIGSPAGSPALVSLFDSGTGAQVDQIRPFQPSYTGGVHVTLADLDRDGSPEIASAASGSPHVVVFDGANP